MAGVAHELHEPAAPQEHLFYPELAVDDEGLALLADFAAGQGWPATAVHLGALDETALDLAAGPAPRLLVLDADAAQDAEQQLRGLVAQLSEESLVLVCGGLNDVGFYRRMIAAGATDYLVKPVTPAALAEALSAAPKAGPSKDDAERGRITLLLGVRGGVGASTIAVNLAWLMAEELAHKTALVDLDLHYGVGALALDLEPGRGLCEALESPDRLDSLLLSSAMLSKTENLCLLSAEESLQKTPQFDTSTLLALLDELTGSFRQIVIDLPRGALPWHRDLLTKADDLVLVSDLSLAGVRDTVRITALADSLGAGATRHVVASRVGKDRPQQIDRASFERSIKGPLAWELPEDAKTVTACANAGKAVAELADRSPIAARLRDMARGLAGETETRKRGLLEKLRLRRPRR